MAMLNPMIPVDISISSLTEVCLPRTEMSWNYMPTYGDLRIRDHSNWECVL